MIGARGLRVRLGGRQVLGGVDFQVDTGETVALVGPNGAGKTTILRCLLGLVGFEGQITIDGIDVRRDPVAAKRRVGYMPQVPVFCEETPLGALAFVAALRGLPAKAAAPLLARVGLEAHARRSVRTFSTGMRQRLSLAAALVGDPTLLVLDEPTASLDLKGQIEIVALLHALQAEGRTVVMSSHRAEEIRALAQRMIVLDEGRIVAAGAVAETAEAVWGKPGDAPGWRLALGVGGA